MASKDQAIGALIFIVCVVIGIGYLIVIVAPGAVSPILGVASQSLQFWAVAIVVLIAFLAIMFIGAWIGWTMATTPPPKPIEELETEEEKVEEKVEDKAEAKVEEKTEPVQEPKTEEKAEPEPPVESKPDRPKRGRRRKTNP